MQFGHILAEILQRRQYWRYLLYLIQKKQCPSWNYLLVGKSGQTYQQTIHINITTEQFCNNLVLVTIDINHVFKLFTAKLP